MTTSDLPPAREFNFDGIVGPTHNYSGLSHGNLASTVHKNLPSNPRAAALQGLEKMKRVAELGVGQAVLPPQRRPNFNYLRSLGFAGSDRQMIEQAAAADSTVLATAYSASNMWTANAATVSPSADCSDGRVHLSIANLASTRHRSLEPEATLKVFQFLFRDPNYFCVHPPLPSDVFADEGAANHMRLAPRHGNPGFECFVFGRQGSSNSGPTPSSPETRFPTRQSLEASRTVAENHRLKPSRTLFIQQNPKAIDAGVFHNDVIAVGNENVLLCHELAFVDQARSLSELTRQFADDWKTKLYLVQIADADLSLDKAVQSYLFNSQLLTCPNGKMCLVCPKECSELEPAERAIQAILAADNPIEQVLYLNLRQSMQNGGGPACLRLRVVMTEAEQAAIHPEVMFRNELYDQLVAWVEEHREQLLQNDLRDPKLVEEVNAAMDDLSRILNLPIGLL